MSKTQTVPTGRTRRTVVAGVLACVHFSDRTTRFILLDPGENPQDALVRLRDPKAHAFVAWEPAYHVLVRFANGDTVPLTLGQSQSPAQAVSNDPRRHSGFTVQYLPAG